MNNSIYIKYCDRGVWINRRLTFISLAVKASFEKFLRECEVIELKNGGRGMPDSGVFNTMVVCDTYDIPKEDSNG
jgi:hypothetical protein